MESLEKYLDYQMGIWKSLGLPRYSDYRSSDYQEITVYANYAINILSILMQLGIRSNYVIK